MSDTKTETKAEGITLTPLARTKAAEFMKKEGLEVVRVTVDAAGKIGLALDKLRPGDKTFVQGDVTVAVAAALATVLGGLSIDFQETGTVGFSFSGDPTKDAAALAQQAKAALAADHSHDDHTAQYLQIGGTLAALTVFELLMTQLPLPKGLMIVGLVVLAFVKAALVGIYFMHLKFERGWKYVILVPPCILACVVIFALMPDIAYAVKDAPPRAVVATTDTHEHH